MASLPTVEEFEASVIAQAGDTPTRLQRWLDVAQEVVEAEVGPLTVREFTTTTDGRVVFLVQPVVEVTSILVGETALTDWTLTGYGVLALPYSYSPTTITYTAGRTTIPASVAEVVLSVAIRLRDQYSGAQVTGYGTDEAIVPGGFPPLSPRDLALLAPYSTRSPAIA